jgi:hypothetical protein
MNQHHEKPSRRMGGSQDEKVEIMVILVVWGY